MKILRELRSRHHLTQIEIGKILGISNKTYSHYETGKRQPDTAMLIKLADHYGVSVDYILGRTDDPNVSQADRLMSVREVMERDEVLMRYDRASPKQQQLLLRVIRLLTEEDDLLPDFEDE